MNPTPAPAPYNPPTPTKAWTSGSRGCLLLLGLLLVVAFPKVWLGLESFFYRDFGVLAYPFVHYHREQFWSGNLWPLWNPLSNCGAPFLAQWGTMVLYPFSLVYLILPLPWSLNLFILGHLLLGGLGIYRLARSWTAHEGASLLASAAYVFGGFTLSAHVWPNYQVALAWMPWVVVAAERAWRHGGPAIPAAALVAALQTLAGVPELLLLTWLALGTLLVVDSWHSSAPTASLQTPPPPPSPEPHSPLPSRLRLHPGLARAAARLLLVGLLTAGLTAAQILPFLDLLELSHRDASFASSKWAMPPWGWGHLLVPLFHAFITPQWTWFQEGQEFVSSYYPGLGILVLALTALASTRDPKTWALGGLALFGLLLALGDHGFLLPTLKHLLPGVGVARYPIKAVALTSFCLPLLAACALAHYDRANPQQQRRTRWLLGALGLCALLGIGAVLGLARTHPFPYDQWHPTLANAAGRSLFLLLTLAALGCWMARPGWPHRRWIPLGLGLISAADGLTHWPNLLPRLDAAQLTPGLARDHLRLNPTPTQGQARVMISPAAEQRLLRSGVSDWAADFLGKRLALWSNLNALELIPKVNGSSTLQLREQAAVQNLLYATPETHLPGLMDFLAVTHASHSNSVVEWTLRPSALPLVTAGQQAIPTPHPAALPALADPAFNPRHVVYVDPEVLPRPGLPLAPNTSITILHATAQQLDFTVHTDQPTLAVIAQSYSHHWRASLDGQPAPLLRANYAFQAVPLTPGTHHVRLRYVDRRFHLGACLSLLTLALSVVAWRRSPPASP